MMELAGAASDEIPMIAAPVLVVDWADREMPSDGPELAGIITGARLVSRDGRGIWYFNPDMDSLHALIRDFVLEHADPQKAAPVAPTTPTLSPPANLSPRELEVLRLIAAGRSNPQIAEALTIAPGTVGRHVSNLLAKTGLSNRVELATYAADHGLRDGDP